MEEVFVLLSCQPSALSFQRDRTRTPLAFSEYTRPVIPESKPTLSSPTTPNSVIPSEARDLGLAES